jgi:replication-associated recombination protein RarA
VEYEISERGVFWGVLTIKRIISIILYGLPGVGRTHLAQALGNLACRIGHTTLFVKSTKLLKTSTLLAPMVAGKRPPEKAS